MKNSRKLTHLVMLPLCALFFFIGAITVQAATYYVATTGSDSNPGTLAQPFRTIAKGVSILKPGDTTFLRAGTYAESINTNFLNFPSGTAWTNPVTLAAYPGERVIMRPGGGGSVIGFAGEADQYIIIDGLILDAINTTIDDAVSINQGSNHIRFKNCEIKNSWANGVGIWWGNNNGLSSDYNEFINCNIHHSGRYDGVGRPDLAAGYGRGHGLYISTSNNVFRGNRVHDNGEYGFHVYISDYPTKTADNNEISGNIIYRNGYNTTRYGGISYGGIVLASGSGSEAYNNLVYDNPVIGIDVIRSASNVKVYNNTSYNNGVWDIQGIIGGSGAIKNNIAYPRGTSIAGGFMLSNNLITDPQFVNGPARDLRLQPGSPALDAGVTLSEVTQDFAGRARPQGSAYDIGAYEFSANQSDLEAPARPVNLSIR